MTHSHSLSTPLAQDASPISKGEAEALCIRLNETMDALNNVIEAETRLIRAGKVREAGHLQAEKAALAAQYMQDVMNIQAHSEVLGLLIPTMVERTRKRHDAFKDNLQANMAALDLARGVSETLIKDIAAEVSIPQTLNTYGANGAGNAYKPNIASIAVDRAL